MARRSERLERLNTLDRGTKQAVAAFVLAAVVAVASLVLYFSLQQRQEEETANREYVMAMVDRNYDKESQVLETFAQHADAEAHSSFEIDIEGVAYGINYLKVGGAYLRSLYNRSDGTVSSNRLVEPSQLDTWLSFDRLQQQRLELLKAGRSADGIEAEIKTLTEENTWLRN